ncbi:hypothetical protein RFI_33188 [Reticulomyxa filosa]|uniref:Uncharacterized protein n=1 Tax=Reticulomyxa filosa TaxID=46433 RepID=X6LU03_RETFI|nr:hypothetical protein RFI_33188 [Reticulomyxa filosa]|eukprot:ETO04210.1 hypothetical protein RFI_33188 [Reticulomyxa filosa]
MQTISFNNEGESCVTCIFYYILFLSLLLEKIDDGIFYKDFKNIQDPVAFYVHQNNRSIHEEKIDQYNVKTNEIIYVHQVQSCETGHKGVILNHLLNSVIDLPSFEFAYCATNNIKNILLEELTPERHIRAQLSEKAQITLPSNIPLGYKKKKKNEYWFKKCSISWNTNYQWSAWKWFEVIHCIFEQCKNELPLSISEMLVSDLTLYVREKHSKLELFFLIPCLNYLSIPSTYNTSVINFLQLFESGGSGWKCDDIEKKNLPCDRNRLTYT